MSESRTPTVVVTGEAVTQHTITVGFRTPPPEWAWHAMREAVLYIAETIGYDGGDSFEIALDGETIIEHDPSMNA